jgi:soluble lytic murein transglycosylase-like protein
MLRFVRHLTFVACAIAAGAALSQPAWARTHSGPSVAYRHPHHRQASVLHRRDESVSRGFASRQWRRAVYSAQPESFGAPFSGFGAPPTMGQRFDAPVQNWRLRRAALFRQQQQSGWQGDNWQGGSWAGYGWQQQSYAYAPQFAGYSENYSGPTAETDWRYARQDFGGGAQLQGMAEQAASANGVPMSLVDRVIRRESGGNPHAVSSGNYGLMQIRLGTARTMGYSGSAAGLLDPSTNLTYAVRYLAGAYRAAGGNENRAVALYARGYNAPRLQEASLYGAQPEGAAMPQQDGFFDSFAPVAPYRRSLRRRVL